MQLAATPSGTMSWKAFELGLCINCRHVGTCLARKERDGYVMFCNEHDSGPTREEEEAMKLEAERRRTETSRSRLPKQADELDGKFKGLCVSCKWRESCSFPGVEGGVWHCEEFE